MSDSLALKIPSQGDCIAGNCAPLGAGRMAIQIDGIGCVLPSASGDASMATWSNGRATITPSVPFTPPVATPR